ncbi:MAG TPA: DUF559 domain-containing protein [Caulobacteraceae bacterium]
MLRAIDHVQIAIPAGGEDTARAFYRDLLGLTEVPKTGVQAGRGGCWFETGDIKVHLGVEEPFRANRKAHVAFLVDDVSGLGQRASTAGFETKIDADLEGYERIFIYDPFGNRLEFLAPFPLDGGRVGDGGGRLSGKSPDGVTAEAAPPPSQPFPRPGGRARHASGAVPRARRLRADMTVAERVLWKELRRLKMNFRRQAPIGRFVVDFVHHDSRLVVEIDGYYHDDPERQARDLQRTAWLQSQGYRVIRFAENAVRDSLFEVVERIAAEAVPPPSPTLPPSRGKGEKRYLVR